MGQQAGRDRCRRLPLFGGPLADWLSVEGAALEVDVRKTGLRMRGCRSNRACAGASVESYKNKPSYVPQRARYLEQDGVTRDGERGKA